MEASGSPSPEPDAVAAALDLGPYAPFHDFATAAAAVLSHLHRRHGMGLWMLTRTVGEDWLVLASHEHGDAYGVEHGTVFRWGDSFCKRMVDEGAPQVAPDSVSVPEYCDAPIAGQVPIGAYIGVPLVTEDGELFGTLCAIDPDPTTGALAAALDEVQLLGRLLMSVLAVERRAAAVEAAAQRAFDEARSDPLCGVLNRRGWDEAVAAEEARCDRYGDVAGVVVVDLDGLKLVNDGRGHEAGDDLLRATAVTLLDSVRRVDVVARTGGDEFAVLVARTDHDAMETLARRIDGAFDRAGVAASSGWAVRDVQSTLHDTIRSADAAMYERKRRSTRTREAAEERDRERSEPAP